MRIPISCMKCFFELNLPNQGEMELNDSRIYFYECSNHHSNIMFLQNQKFDILFELAVKAFQDGYYNQAVFNFMASLERFHEFCIKVMMFYKHKKDNKEFDFFESFEQMWLMVKKQSERQYGIFISMYFSSFGRVPKNTEKIKMSSKESLNAYRNNVIHNGAFSNHDDASKFGELVYNYMKEIINVLRTELPNESIINFDLEEQKSIIVRFCEEHPEIPHSVQALPSCMSLATAEFPPFQNYLMSGETAFEFFESALKQENLEYNSVREEKDYKLISVKNESFK